MKFKGPSNRPFKPPPQIKMGWGGLPFWTTFEANLMLKLKEKIQKSNHPSICSLSLLKLSEVRELVGCVRPRKKPQSNSNHSNRIQVVNVFHDFMSLLVYFCISELLGFVWKQKQSVSSFTCFFLPPFFPHKNKAKFTSLKWASDWRFHARKWPRLFV